MKVNTVKFTLTRTSPKRLGSENVAKLISRLEKRVLVKDRLVKGWKLLRRSPSVKSRVEDGKTVFDYTLDVHAINVKSRSRLPELLTKEAAHMHSVIAKFLNGRKWDLQPVGKGCVHLAWEPVLDHEDEDEDTVNEEELILAKVTNRGKRKKKVEEVAEAVQPAEPVLVEV